ncbi:hypothetical protein, partial [Enterococcus faecalis]|uniref:hypothetical protein n=1 Tax=Enterococcus faecalis TaxID=1351 RepID=UPI003D097912
MTVKLGDANFADNGIGLTFSPQVTTNVESATSSKAFALNNESQQLASVANDAVRYSDVSTAVRLHASLNIPNTTKATTYTTTLVWNVVAQPTDDTIPNKIMLQDSLADLEQTTSSLKITFKNDNAAEGGIVLFGGSRGTEKELGKASTSYDSGG